MWGSKKAKHKQHQSTTTHFDTLISAKTQIVGDLQFSGGLHIDGLVRGTIRAEEDSEAIVRISDIGEIDGDVIAPHIIVNGTVHGDVYASKHIELAANASIKGNVYYHLIEMAMGAEVNGNLVHHKEPVSIKHHDSQDSTTLPEQVSLKAISSDTKNQTVTDTLSSATAPLEKAAKSSNTSK
jgi:cytoskeletal protein CcmA (bactofilin family)